MYAVKFVSETEAARAGLPDDQPWVMARTADDSTYLFVRDGVTAEALEEAWAAFRWLALNRPAAKPDVPNVRTVSLGSDEIRRAVIAAQRVHH